MSRLFLKMTVLISGLLTLLACTTSSTALAPTPPTTAQPVVATAWTAEMIGELVVVNHCIRVHERDSDTSYLLVWPPDTTTTIHRDTIRVVSGAMTGKRTEVVFPIGAMVRLSGGETDQRANHLQQTVPAPCVGPYWMVGFEIGPFESR